MSDDWLGGDPFADPDDPAAREREERRREREEKRQRKAEKQAKKGAGASGDSGDGSPSQQRGGSVDPSSESPREPAADSPVAPASAPDSAEVQSPPRTPDEEFWDEQPAHEFAGAASGEREADEGDDDRGGGAGGGEATLAGAAAPQPEVPGEIEETEAERASSEPREAEWVDEGLPQEPGVPAGGGGGSGRSRGGVLGALRRHPFRIAGVVLALVVVWFLWSLFQPFHGDGSGRVAVTIPKGSSVSEVGDLLGEKGVIDSSTFFQIRATIEGKRSSLYAGHFTLAEGMSYSAALDALSKPPQKRALTVTIPEGYSRSQAAQLIEEDGVPGSYTKATLRSKYLNPAQYGGKGAKDLEGFLFPDTFEMKPNAPVADLVQLQLEDFKRRIKGVDMKYAKSKNLTVFDVLTIASMVEREAGVAKQRKLVASVIYNRLHEGMPLGIDATIRFATGNYSEPLTESQLATSSPYNTRTNVGLPPGPINSPGLAAIEAAAHPAKTDYLYYVNNPDSCNELSFAKTDAEFEADVRKYEDAREAASGNAPSTCGE
jgi:peptidoglycan lytic transglycosylase G